MKRIFLGLSILCGLVMAGCGSPLRNCGAVCDDGEQCKSGVCDKELNVCGPVNEDGVCEDHTSTDSLTECTEGCSSNGNTSNSTDSSDSTSPVNSTGSTESTGNFSTGIGQTTASSPVCGNSRVERGEECDDGGDSKECDDDCTLVMCGDGEVNEAAGEECDDGTESEDCDGDCTLVMCGDGELNEAAGEECDDGAESEDCDGDCTLVMCGDGEVNEAAGEECDDGVESEYCDGNCTLVVCGDGEVNEAAGEECDDESGNCTKECCEIPTESVCGDGIVSGDEHCDWPLGEKCVVDMGNNGFCNIDTDDLTNGCKSCVTGYCKSSGEEPCIEKSVLHCNTPDKFCDDEMSKCDPGQVCNEDQQCADPP